MSIRRVVGDPGHGGAFPGAVNRSVNLFEKDVNLAVALDWRKIAVANGYDAWLTRDTDKNFLPNSAKDIYYRADLINSQGADLCISFHVNASDKPTPDYLSTWVCQGAHPETRRIAQLIQDDLVKATGWEDGGVREARFAILTRTRMPAIVIELGFISNPLQASLLKKPEFRYVLAEAVVRGMCRFNGQAFIEAGGKVQPVPKSDGYREIRAAGTSIHVYEIHPRDCETRISLGVPGKLEPLSAIVKREGADAAINLGFFEPSGKSEHYGLLIQEGVIKNPPNRQAEVFLTNDNRLIVSDISTNAEVPQGIKWGAGGGFALRVNGKKSILAGNQFTHTNQDHPRTALGQKADGTLLLVVADGRTSGNAGMTANDLEALMAQLGAMDAISFDGGGSSELYVDGAIKNKPSDGRERSIGSALLVFRRPADHIIIDVRGQLLDGKLINERTWGPMAPAMDILNIPWEWESNERKMIIK